MGETGNPYETLDDIHVYIGYMHVCTPLKVGASSYILCIPIYRLRGRIWGSMLVWERVLRGDSSDEGLRFFLHG